MRQIDVIDIRSNGKRVELWEGDLTDWPDGVEVDALVVSAFPSEYSPTPHSVIGALDRKGVSVAMLARHKDVDIREHYSCWLSRPLAAIPGMPYRHIVCFEPLARGKAPELVGDIFRALVPMAMIRDGLRTVAMPIVASGDQRNQAEDILPPLVDAALHWLEVGHPVERVIIVSQSKAKTEMAQKVFVERKAAYSKAAPAQTGDFAYDIFISYAHKNRALADALSKALLDARSDLRIFVDRQELDVGMAWQPTLFDSLAKSRKVIALLSPDYIESKACQEEFNIAWIRARRTQERVLLPVYGFSASIPDWMLFWQYVDCREGDDTRLSEVVSRVLRALDEAPVSVMVPSMAPHSIDIASSADAGKGERMPCPRCAESIMRAARMCRFCTLDLSGDYPGPPLRA